MIDLRLGDCLELMSSNDVWRGTDVHICADGYCETATFGYGAEIRCARCGEFYSPAHDETI